MQVVEIQSYHKKSTHDTKCVRTSVQTFQKTLNLINSGKSPCDRSPRKVFKSEVRSATLLHAYRECHNKKVSLSKNWDL